MKRVFGWVEIVFDILYLIIAIMIGFYLVITSKDDSLRLLSGLMAFILVGGDIFHLIPRIRVILSKEEIRFRRALGTGKLITSITMTVFYIIKNYIAKKIYYLRFQNILP